MSGPAALPVHRIAGRTRLRIRAQRGDAGYFEHVAEELSTCPGVRSVRVAPRTASVLLEHEAPLEAIGQFAATRGLFEIDATPKEARPLLPRLYAEVQAVDRAMRERTEREWDLETLAFFGLAAAGAYQIARGHVFPAGITMVAQAAQLLAAASARADAR